jgi:tRNA modification GTPase
LRDPADGEPLDRALLLWFPGPRTATGEDLAELHIHGGRSVAMAVQAALGRIPGLRAALPGEFTRRAFANGVLDLAEAEGLADLLAAETESQRRAALTLVSGALSRQIETWRQMVLGAAARIEAVLDFADEGDVEADTAPAYRAASAVAAEIEAALTRPPAERLRDGIRVVLAGPPNAGKSTLLNALAGREAAITAPSAGTTRDVIEAPVAIAGVPYLLTDTAGLRESADAVERIGVVRAQEAIDAADILLWLGDPANCPVAPAAIRLHAKADLAADGVRGTELAVSAVTGQGMDALRDLLAARAAALLPREGELALNVRQREALAECAAALRDTPADLTLFAESLRAGCRALDRVTGRAGVEDMLDALFGRFCIGK